MADAGDGRVGFGMSEHLDQIVDGKALGRAMGHRRRQILKSAKVSQPTKLADFNHLLRLRPGRSRPA